MILALRHRFFLPSRLHCNVPTNVKVMRAGHSLNLSQVTIHIYCERLHQKKHKNSHLPKPYPAAMWLLEYPLPSTLAKLANKHSLFQTLTANSPPQIAASTCPGPGLPTQVPASQLAFHSAHFPAPLPQNLTLSSCWLEDWFNISQTINIKGWTTVVEATQGIALSPSIYSIKNLPFFGAQIQRRLLHDSISN